MYQTIGFIGTGNMGSAIAKAAARSGLAETILLANRTPAKAEAVAALCPGRIRPVSWPAAGADELAQADLLVNATSLGMAGQGQFEGFDFLELLPETCLVSDLIYHPAPTELLKHAAALGLETMDGFPLLIHQAVLALEHFTGQAIPVDAVLPALERVVGAQG